jgi:hypothetical protein
MPSKRSKPQVKSAPSAQGTGSHVAFFPLLVLVFLVWLVYRQMLPFPPAFDETIGKAVFFGLPVWIYFSVTRSKSMMETFSIGKFQPGLLLGLAVGGVYGFAATLLSFALQKPLIVAAPLFATTRFWGEFFIAIMNGLWESLLFYTWIMVVIQEKYRKWSLFNQIVLTALIFLVFHLPNLFLTLHNSPGMLVPAVIFSQMSLLFCFGLGQAMFFARTRNLYAMMLSSAIWQMVFLIHTRPW